MKHLKYFENQNYEILGPRTFPAYHSNSKLNSNLGGREIDFISKKEIDEIKSLFEEKEIFSIIEKGGLILFLWTNNTSNFDISISIRKNVDSYFFIYVKSYENRDYYKADDVIGLKEMLNLIKVNIPNKKPKKENWVKSFFSRQKEL